MIDWRCESFACSSTTRRKNKDPLGEVPFKMRKLFFFVITLLKDSFFFSFRRCADVKFTTFTKLPRYYEMLIKRGKETLVVTAKNTFPCVNIVYTYYTFTKSRQKVWTHNSTEEISSLMITWNFAYSEHFAIKNILALWQMAKILRNFKSLRLTNH